MRRDEIRQALDEDADRRLGGAPDVWPAVHRAARARRPAAGRIVIEPAGVRARWALPTVALLALLVAAAVLAPALRPPTTPGATTPTVHSGGGAATPALPSSPVGRTPLPGAGLSPAPDATPGTPGPASYADFLTADLAKRLGVAPPALDAAFATAARETIDQAVRDGGLTPDAAAQAKAQAGQGLTALLARALDSSGADPASGDTTPWLESPPGASSTPKTP